MTRLFCRRRQSSDCGQSYVTMRCRLWGFLQFMQRGLDAETKQQLEEDQKRIISDEHWYLDLPELKAKE